jgi:hypothetical protein
MDIKGLGVAPAPIEGSLQSPLLSREGRLLSHIISGLEHQVWEEITGREFVSTVKGFQIVSELFPSAAPLFAWDQSNWTFAREFILETFPFDRLSEDALDYMEDRVLQNNARVIVPSAAAVGAAGRCDCFIVEIQTEGGISYEMAAVFEGTVAGFGGPFGDALATIPSAIRQDQTSFVTALSADPVSMVSGNNHLTERDWPAG